MKRSLFRKRPPGRYILIAVVISAMSASAMGPAFADMDIGQLLKTWYEKKTEAAQQLLAEEINGELIIQKQRMNEEITELLEQSQEELDSYTQDEIDRRKEALRLYATQLLSELDISNEDDKNQVYNKLDAILTSAMLAMDDLSGSYIPPSLRYDAPTIETVPVEAPALPQSGGGSPGTPAAVNPQIPVTTEPASPIQEAPPGTEGPVQEVPVPTDDKTPADISPPEGSTDEDSSADTKNPAELTPVQSPVTAEPAEDTSSNELEPDTASPSTDAGQDTETPSEDNQSDTNIAEESTSDEPDASSEQADENEETTETQKMSGQVI